MSAGDAGGVQARGAKEVKIPKAEIPVTTVKAPESTVQMYGSTPFHFGIQGCIRLIVCFQTSPTEDHSQPRQPRGHESQT